VGNDDVGVGEIEAPLYQLCTKLYISAVLFDLF